MWRAGCERTQHASRVPISGIGVGLSSSWDPAGEIRSDYLISGKALPRAQSLARLRRTRFESTRARRPLPRRGLRRRTLPANFIYLTIGTGISHWPVLEGKPYAGAHGSAIIAGSGILNSACEQCGATMDRSLEDFAPAPRSSRAYNQAQRNGACEWRTGDAAAAAGDTRAREVVLGRHRLRQHCGFLVNALDPQALIVAADSGSPAACTGTASSHRHARGSGPRPAAACRSSTARLGLDAGLVGAALCARVRIAPAVGYS